MEFIKGIELPYKILRAYGQICKGICKKTQIPQPAFDILMFHRRRRDQARNITPNDGEQ